MKCLLTLFLFLGVYSAKSASTNEEHERNVDGIREFLKRKCLKNANIESLDELAREVKDIPVCRNGFSLPWALSEYYSYVCLNNTNYDCLVKIQEKIEPCLDSEEKYLKDFIVSTYNATIDYLCKDGEEAFEGIIRNYLQSTTVSCPHWAELLESRVNPSCLREINLELSNNPDLIITKSYLCSKLEEVAECLSDGFKKRCPDDTLPNFIKEEMQLLLNWCVENDSRK